MVDVSNGKIRVRKWPRKRGPPKTEAGREHVEWFRQANWATKFWDPMLVSQIIEATAGSPLMPRDLMLQFMAGRAYYLVGESGVKIYPMAAKRDVSESLDVIAQQEGMLMYRGPTFWEPIEQGETGWLLRYGAPGAPPYWSPTGPGGAGWTPIYDGPVDTGVPTMDFTGLESWSDLVLIARGITSSVSEVRFIRGSCDGGSTYFSGASSYQVLGADGTLTGASTWGRTTVASAAARTLYWEIIDKNGAARGAQTNNGRVMLAANTVDPVDAIRIGTGAGNMTGGTVYLGGR